MSISTNMDSAFGPLCRRTGDNARKKTYGEDCIAPSSYPLAEGNQGVNICLVFLSLLSLMEKVAVP